MPNSETLGVFFLASVLLALAPGPDNLFVMLQSAAYGRRAGLAIVLGLATGLVGHTAGVALGLAALVAASGAAFLILKGLGACYLLYLAWRAWRAPATVVPGAENRRPLSGSRGYLRGVVMNLSNPKVGLFFLAFLPQFTSPERGSVLLQVVALGAMFIIATLLVFGSIAVFGAALGSLLQRSARAQRWLNRLSALVFVGLAARLAAAQR